MDPGDLVGVAKAPAHQQSAVVESCGVLREKALAGGVDSPAKKPPLSAVGVSRQGQVDGQRLYVFFVILGLVTEEQLVAPEPGKGFQPFCIGIRPGIEFNGSKTPDVYPVKLSGGIVQKHGSPFCHLSPYVALVAGLVIAQDAEGGAKSGGEG